ncbi:MAG: HAMP domain-containing sensor histidine kinase [Gordonia sp. (in: high G+C Gram-positive bacteria)]|uniref:sensor histidine kinase n=1 Tax=Gordonia sp. (in: high G+C Gram-positive bacteria) TaxID=84139 RepID=UPI0039E4F15B
MAVAAPPVTRVPAAAARRRGIPLRVSLVVLTLVLVILGLLASGLAVTSAMRSDLIDRVDNGLTEATGSWARPPQAGHDQPGPAGPRRPPSKYFVEVSFGSGDTFVTSDYTWTPDLTNLPDGDAGPLTVPSTGDGPDWRVIKRESGTDSVVVAIPLKDVDDTLSRLIWLQTGIGLIVVIVIGVLSYLLVRSSLRPLRRVEETAHAIALGDLNRRIPETAANTEVGSLSDSLNGMLGQIQYAFAGTAASEQQARASEARMRQFVADASHELRTPLTSIKGFADLIDKGMTDDPADGVRRISGEAQRMSLLVEDLLVLARLDAHRPLAKAPVAMDSLVHDAVAAAQAAAPKRTIVVDDRTGDDPGPIVEGDADRLTQVLRNLIDNALRYAPAGPVTVVVAQTPDQARVDVVDQGPGLSADDADRVFERFYRGDPSRHREESTAGSGLGLSIVSAIVGAHNGQVGVASAPDQGARFWFTLPVWTPPPEDKSVASL